MLNRKSSKLFLVINLAISATLITACGKSDAPSTTTSAAAAAPSTSTTNSCQFDNGEFSDSDANFDRKSFCDNLRKNAFHHSCDEDSRHKLFDKRCDGMDWNQRNDGGRRQDQGSEQM